MLFGDGCHVKLAQKRDLQDRTPRLMRERSGRASTRDSYINTIRICRPSCKVQNLTLIECRLAPWRRFFETNSFLGTPTSARRRRRWWHLTRQHHYRTLNIVSINDWECLGSAGGGEYRGSLITPVAELMRETGHPLVPS